MTFTTEEVRMIHRVGNRLHFCLTCGEEFETNADDRLYDKPACPNCGETERIAPAHRSRL